MVPVATKTKATIDNIQIEGHTLFQLNFIYHYRVWQDMAVGHKVDQLLLQIVSHFRTRAMSQSVSLAN